MSDQRTFAQRVEDNIEEAWIRGDISHADACSALAELGDRP